MNVLYLHINKMELPFKTRKGMTNLHPFFTLFREKRKLNFPLF